MINRTLFNEDHGHFRNALEGFSGKHIVPHLEGWDERGGVDRKLWLKLAEQGFLCTSIPIEYGGSECDRLFSMVMLEVLAPLGGLGISIAMHSDIVAPYILNYGTEDAKQKYLPRMATGELIGALAMTEPSGGSDVQQVKSTAVLHEDHYILNGSKTFISNGYESGVVVVVARTKPEGGSKGLSLLLVDETMPGLTKGKKLKKVGLKSQDTAELFFTNLKVPRENILGEINHGFSYLMNGLTWERLQLAIAAIASSWHTYQETVTYVNERTAFGSRIVDFQNTRFKLAELKTEIQIGQVFVDRCMELLLSDQLDVETVSMAKYWCTDLQCRVADECVQLHGGYGFMQEYAVARAWTDSRAQRIYGGTNEIMKELIGRSTRG